MDRVLEVIMHWFVLGGAWALVNWLLWHRVGEERALREKNKSQLEARMRMIEQARDLEAPGGVVGASVNSVVSVHREIGIS